MLLARYPTQRFALEKQALCCLKVEMTSRGLHGSTLSRGCCVGLALGCQLARWIADLDIVSRTLQSNLLA